MPRPLNLHWKAPATTVTRRWRMAMVLATAALVASVGFWWQAAAQVQTLTEQRTARLRPIQGQRAPLGEQAQGELRDEIQGVNQLIRQLNQQWDILLADVQPVRPTVRLLEVEVDARGQRVRLVGSTAKVAEMVDYVAELTNRASLKEVALARHEADKESGGYRFVVEAVWVDGR